MLHIYASLAEKERALISERTKAALAAKRGGRKLDTAGSVETAARARAARSEQTSKANATTLKAIARSWKRAACGPQQVGTAGTQSKYRGCSRLSGLGRPRSPR
jgi:DNA invertase Pin-like site-specific DNA recombinase